jgi:hypothetical protein
MAALAATTLLAAACTKDGGRVPNSDRGEVVIRIEGVNTGANTRAIELPGDTSQGTIKLFNGHIFVVDPVGTVIYKESLNLTTSVSPNGQKLGSPVPADSRVYVVANIPLGDLSRISSLSSFEAIEDAASLMTTQTDYTMPGLANSTGIPANITLKTAASGSTPAVYETVVRIKPLISRLELVALQGDTDDAGNRITGFNVTGVYIDHYFDKFSYNGYGMGNMYSMGIGTPVLGSGGGIGDEGTWGALLPALPAPQRWTATPNISLTPGQELWAYNVAPSPEITSVVPRLIIRLEGITYSPAGGGVDVTINETRYLTVYGYTGVDAFERGKIYRIGVVGDNDLIFDLDNLGETPNSTTVELIVKVVIEEWVVETPTAEL